MFDRKAKLDPRFSTPSYMRVFDMDELGGLIRLRRRELGMTQSDVADRTGFSMRLVGEIERGKVHVGIDKVFSVLDSLNMTMSIRVEGK